MVAPAPTEGEAEDGTEILPAELVHFLLSSPTEATIVWAEGNWLTPQRVLALASQGVREVIVRGEQDNIANLKRVLAELLHGHRTEQFLASLPPTLPADIRGLISTLLVPSMDPISPADMARMTHCDRGTLHRHFSRSGLPPPRAMLGWIRVYLVLYLVDEGMNVEAASMRVGFNSVSGFCRMADRRLGVSEPSELKRIGWKGLLRALDAEIRRRSHSFGAA